MKTIPFDKKVWCNMTFDNDDLANKGKDYRIAV